MLLKVFVGSFLVGFTCGFLWSMMIWSYQYKQIFPIVWP